MNKTNATIRIKSLCETDDDVIELITEGAFYEKNGSFYILYDENEEMGMADCSVMVKITEDEVVITRKGSFSSRMIYRTDRVTEFIYYMPYGSIPIILDTKNINSDLDKNGGVLELKYSLDIQGEEHINTMKMTVKAD